MQEIGAMTAAIEPYIPLLLTVSFSFFYSWAYSLIGDLGFAYTFQLALLVPVATLDAVTFVVIRQSYEQKPLALQFYLTKTICLLYSHAYPLLTPLILLSLCKIISHLSHTSNTSRHLPLFLFIGLHSIALSSIFNGTQPFLFLLFLLGSLIEVHCGNTLSVLNYIHYNYHLYLLLSLLQNQLQCIIAYSLLTVLFLRIYLLLTHSAKCIDLALLSQIYPIATKLPPNEPSTDRRLMRLDSLSRYIAQFCLLLSLSSVVLAGQLGIHSCFWTGCSTACAYAYKMDDFRMIPSAISVLYRAVDRRIRHFQSIWRYLAAATGLLFRQVYLVWECFGANDGTPLTYRAISRNWRLELQGYDHKLQSILWGSAYILLILLIVSRNCQLRQEQLLAGVVLSLPIFLWVHLYHLPQIDRFDVAFGAALMALCCKAWSHQHLKAKRQ